jgi:hypothetical protein
VDVFNIVVGLAGLFAAVFALYTYMQSRRERAVETQKAAEYQQRVADLLSMANAVAKQATLAATLADRDDVTKKELKHLILGELATIESIQSSLARIKAVEQRWEFGVPGEYLKLESDKSETKKSGNSPTDAMKPGAQ